MVGLWDHIPLGFVSGTDVILETVKALFLCWWMLGKERGRVIVEMHFFKVFRQWDLSKTALDDTFLCKKYCIWFCFQAKLNDWKEHCRFSETHFLYTLYCIKEMLRINTILCEKFRTFLGYRPKEVVRKELCTLWYCMFQTRIVNSRERVCKRICSKEYEYCILYLSRISSFFRWMQHYFKWRQHMATPCEEKL